MSNCESRFKICSEEGGRLRQVHKIISGLAKVPLGSELPGSALEPCMGMLYVPFSWLAACLNGFGNENVF